MHTLISVLGLTAPTLRDYTRRNMSETLTTEERSRLWAVIRASSAGTLIEWYDFYIFGSLATVISAQFFPKENPTAALLSTLAIFATGFIVRPFGALVFGRLGDVVGRKHAFLVTLLMMGVSTFGIGLIPSYAQIGVAAPLLVLLLRLTQGLALGGEYGGAATYVAEHAPDHKRGYYTSFIQTTATLGLLVSIVIIIGGQVSLGKEAFESWGWRIPFLLSAVLVVFSYLVRRKMQESPLFTEMKQSGTHSKNPLRDSFANKSNLKLVVLALLGATMGQGVVWYTGQFYALYFLQTELKVEKVVANGIVAIALILATPLFVLFGSLSDRIGRKKIMLTGMVLAVLTYVPVFSTMSQLSHFESGTASGEAKPGKPVSVKEADKKLGTQPGDTVIEVKTPVVNENSFATQSVKTIKFANGNPDKTVKSFVDIRPSALSLAALTLLVFFLVALVTMVYGPIAAFLVELFPTRIRYSSMSLPYHIGNGVFGGLVPLVGTAVVANTGIQTAGLWYPIAVAGLCFVIGALFLPDRRDVKLTD